MTGFDDLLMFASRAGRIANNPCNVTEGKTLSQWYGLKDSTGALIDFSTGYTFEVKVLTGIDGTEVLTSASSLTVTGVSDGWTIAATAAAMAGKAGTGATESDPRRCLWYCAIVRTSDSAELQVWGPSGSPFMIAPE